MALIEADVLVRRAAEVATQAHHGQVRAGDGTVPYIAHPAEVAQILVQHGIDRAPILAAAWLHDVVEDTALTLADLTSFGPTVMDLVGRLTKRPGQSHADYYQRIWESREATLIKLADRISNLRTYYVKGLDKLQRYVAFTEQDYIVRDVYGLWDTLQDTLQQIRRELYIPSASETNTAFLEAGDTIQRRHIEAFKRLAGR